MKDFLDKCLNLSGGTYVGMSTIVALTMALGEFLTNGYKAPVWFVTVPLGIYAFILGLFVIKKGSDYIIDSKYNSPPNEKPQ